ncbi:hypothetical protein FQN51_007504 [Onygenales sp. PD_10]|nr:hypothetical protein FQN51_007504 [Onygenales sp. PD_10]
MPLLAMDMDLDIDIDTPPDSPRRPSTNQPVRFPPAHDPSSSRLRADNHNQLSHPRTGSDENAQILDNRQQHHHHHTQPVSPADAASAIDTDLETSATRHRRRGLLFNIYTDTDTNTDTNTTTDAMLAMQNATTNENQTEKPGATHMNMHTGIEEKENIPPPPQRTTVETRGQGQGGYRRRCRCRCRGVGGRGQGRGQLWGRRVLGVLNMDAAGGGGLDGMDKGVDCDCECGGDDVFSAEDGMGIGGWCAGGWE